MPIDGQEQVLCVGTRALLSQIRVNDVQEGAMAGQIFQGFRRFSCEAHARLTLNEISAAEPMFLARTHRLEADPSFKQIIPYGYLSSQSKVWLYQRAGQHGDPRLRNRVTPGVGGHVNPIDAGRSLSETLLNGLSRELTEEVLIGCTWQTELVGLVNDDSDPVGSVHLGVVYEISLGRRDALARDPALKGLGWHTYEGLRALVEADPHAFEGWFRMLVEQHLCAIDSPEMVA